MTEESTVKNLVKYDQQIAEYREQKYNILLPTLKFQSIPDMCEIAFNIVQINPDPQKKEVYKQKSNNELSHTKHGIDKLAAAAGVLWDWRGCGRLDNGSDPRYCHYRMVGTAKDFDGTIRNYIGDKEVDLRDNSDQIANMTEKQIAQQREHVLSLAQSKASNRALRGLLQIKHSYSADELKYPFIVPKLIFRPDLNDPMIKQAYINQMFQANAAAFGNPTIEATSPTRLTLPEPDEPEDILLEPEKTETELSGEVVSDDESLPWEEPPVSEEKDIKILFQKMDANDQIEELKRLIKLTNFPIGNITSPMETWKDKFLLEFHELLLKRWEKEKKDKNSKSKKQQK